MVSRLLVRLRNIPAQAITLNTLSVIGLFMCVCRSGIGERPDPVIRIMPLGDSITESFAGDTTYRYFLWKFLRESGMNIDFVGSRTGVLNGKPGCSDYDQDHEGHCMGTAKKVAQRIRSWARSAHPDVVLVHLGTMDSFWDAPSSEYADETTQNLKQIIENLRSVNPRIRILLATLIPSRSGAKIDSLNARLPALAAKTNTETSPIVLVDMHGTVKKETDFEIDRVHPNGEGQRKMAKQWALAVSHLYGIIPAPYSTPSAGMFVDSVTVELGTVSLELEIRYTTDGTDPGLHSQLYTRGLHLTGDTSVLFKTCALTSNGRKRSAVVSARFTVACDTTQPELICAAGSSLDNSVLVTFSEQMDILTAGDPSHYAISGNVTVSAAQLLDDGSSVRLTTSPLQEHVTHSLIVGDLADASMRRNRISGSAKTSFTVQATGRVVRKYWFDSTGNFRDSGSVDPDGMDTLRCLAGPVNWADNYNVIISGFLSPPITGTYRFWIAADKVGKLLLSTDETSGRLACIAEATDFTWPQKWTAFPEQQSEPISLAAGKRYYFRCVQKAVVGGDHVAVAWSIPGAARRVVDGVYVSGQ